MIRRNALFSSLLILAQIGCVSAQPAQQLKVTVLNDRGAPIEDTEVSVHFRPYKGEPEIVTRLTDENGYVQVTGNAPLPPHVFVRKEGFYESRLEKVGVITPQNAKSPLASKSLEMVLREVLSPRPLAAKDTELEIPVKDEWIGYDLELGEWVEPYGEGEHTDLLFRYSNEFLGYTVSDKKLEEIRAIMRKWSTKNGKEWTTEMERNSHGEWSGKLELKFPGEQEGILPVPMGSGYVPESLLHLPHNAEEAGYEPRMIWEQTMPSQRIDQRKGYFLRLRVRERNGQILEANYAKINEEVRFDPRGKVTFTYYFNPDVNDRNLEFNTNKNLLKNLDYGEQVKLP